MPFQKGNKLGSKYDKPVGEMIGFRGRKGHKQALEKIPNWKEKLRDFIDELIQNS